MAVNKNALIRYKTLDKCLQNKYRKWTLDDLIEACSDALYEYEGIDKGVSKRTVQSDLQMMRSDKLGYNAPIIVIDKKYYAYEDPEYSITNIPLTEGDLSKLYEAVDFLKQFQGFSHFKELDGMVQKLEDHVYAQKNHQKPVIDFEKNENLIGLNYLDTLYRAIIQKKALYLSYQSFKAREPISFNFHAYLLKEFRNRWFLIGIKKKQQGILYLALDRIKSVEPSEIEYIENTDIDWEEFFKHAIGVSVSPNLPTDKVVLYITNKHAPYVLTKPFHWSQKLIDRDNYGITISLDVQHNFELEKDILGIGDGIKVIKPARLRRNIKDRLQNAIDLYNTELNEGGLITAGKKLTHKGYAIINFIYTKREVNRITAMVDNFFKTNGEENPHAKRSILQKIPNLREVLMNKNLKRIVDTIDENAVLVKSMYFDKPPQSNWYVTWHQDQTINVKEKIEVEGYSGWTNKDGLIGVCPPEALLLNTFTIRIHLNDANTENGALKVIPGSHHKKLTDTEIKLITESSFPTDCEVAAGGVQIMRPLLLHASAKTTSQKRRRVLHLEFTSSTLPEGLTFFEE